VTFRAFIARHAGLSREGIVLVPEAQVDIYGTYAMVGPNGCFFDNSLGTYRYSRPIVSVGIEAAWSEDSVSPDRFRGRCGNYDFATAFNRQEIAHENHPAADFAGHALNTGSPCALKSNGVLQENLQGKRLKVARHLISVPLGRRWRACLFRQPSATNP